MPQHEAFKELRPIIPPANPVVDHTPPRSPLGKFPVNKPLTTCFGEGINKPSDTDTPDMDENFPPPSPSRFHRRASLLSRQESLVENPIESSNFPEPSTSPSTLSPAERDQLAEFERPQQRCMDTWMFLEADRQHVTTADKHKGQEPVEEPVEMDAETEYEKEKHMLRGGWMHRSRASCELLRDRKSWNVGGD